MSRDERQTAAAIIVGNELLSGKIADGNLSVLARTLRSLGVTLERAVTVRDNLETIACEVADLAGRFDVVFTSGGIGPTHDDVTTAAVAAAFQVGLTHAPIIEQMLRTYYGTRLTEGHLLMARIPDGARLVTSPEMPWPTVVMRNVWVLPGIPEVFALKMPVVAQELAGRPPLVSLALFTTLDEGALKPFLDRVVSEEPAVEIGSYPQWGESRYKTKVTFDGDQPALIERARAFFASSLPEGSIVEMPQS